MTERKKRSEDELEPDKIPEELVRIHDVPDEATGMMLADFLREQGIDAALQPVEISMLPGVESIGHGHWGSIEVLGRDVERAQVMIQDFFAARPEPRRAKRAADAGSEPTPDPESAA